MNTKVRPRGRELYCIVLVAEWTSKKLSAIKGLPAEPLNLCFPNFSDGRIIRPLPEESESVGLEGLFLVNTSGDHYHEGSLGNPVESNQRLLPIQKDISDPCSQAPPARIPQNVLTCDSQ